MLTSTIDTRGLDFMLNGVKNALVGTGGDVSELTKDESRLLALGIMKVAQPKDRRVTAARIAGSMWLKFGDLGESYSPKGKTGADGVEWYRSSSKFLYGVAEDKDMRGASIDSLAGIYYQARKGDDGKTRVVSDFNPPRPSGQKKAVLQKVSIDKKDKARLYRFLVTAIGKLPASWLATAKQIDGSAAAPKWISRHLKGGNKTTKSITDLSGLNNVEHPSTTFGSKARGVNRFGRAVQFAVNLREKKMAWRLKLILSGYAQDVKNGIAVHRHAKSTKGQP